MYDPGAAVRELLSNTWRGVVRRHLESRGWWQHVSGFSSSPPHLYLHPAAPEEIEATLTDLMAQGLVVERAILTLER